ncbi:MAG: hypothetical protein Q8922_15680 [Bacteroidota bacterium]|nr:hypothetical protein [Bacteroidota bacterium]MDP4233855.1 hypothetical protein [Bacteroidota bacterium]MDP4243528.1 hypothetical protein [Bacteroidota bacterium]MDP4289355.1 hypothetical protein [Bacteroidota bacterium]
MPLKRYIAPFFFIALTLVCADSLRAQWAQVRPSDSSRLDAIFSFGNRLFLGSEMGTFYSEDSGDHWVNTMIGPSSSFAVIGDHLFAAGASRISISLDSGKLWTQADNGLSGRYYYIVSAGTALFASTFPGGLNLSMNSGSTWTPIQCPIDPYPNISAFGTTVFAGSFGRVFRSTDGGSSWKEVSPPFAIYSGDVIPPYTFRIDPKILFYRFRFGLGLSALSHF